MKKLSLLVYPVIVLLSLASVGVAFAQGEVIEDSTANAQSLKTRQQVKDELAQARADGSINVWSIGYNPLATAKVTYTRAYVRSQRDLKYDRTWYSEDSGSFAIANEAGGKKVIAQ